MSVGAVVGFAVDLGEGSLRKVKGILVEQDSDSVTVAVPPGIAPESSEPVEVPTASGGVCAVSFISVAIDGVTSDLDSWTKVSMFAEMPVVPSLLRAYYKLDLEIKRVETDSMVSAHSSAKAAAGLVSSQPRAMPVHPSRSASRSAGSQQVTFADSDEDEDFAAGLMKQFAAAQGQEWGVTDAAEEIPFSAARSEQTYQSVVNRLTGKAKGKTGEKILEEGRTSAGSDQVIMMALMELLKKQ